MKTKKNNNNISENELIKNIFQKLDGYQIQGPIVVGVSGGCDSVFLIYVVGLWIKKNNKSDQDVIVCLLDHGVRHESSQEVLFFSNYFSNRFPNYKIFTSKYEGKNKSEKNLRERRHQEFINLAKKHNSKFIFLGHHLNDRLETAFLNMYRGCHINGFVSLKEFEKHRLDNSVSIVRPLIDTNKTQILDFCKQNEIKFFHDYTNDDSEISLRNKFRNEVLPSLIFDKDGKSTNFLRSFLNISNFIEKQIEENISKENKFIEEKKIEFKKHEIPFFWDADSRYSFDFIDDFLSHFTGDCFINILKKIGVYNLVSNKNMKILYDFVVSKESGYKYFFGVYFFLSHGRVHIIVAKKDFWLIENRKKGCSEQYVKNKIIQNFVDKTGLESDLVFLKSPDRIYKKRISQYCINKKIPVFFRNVLLGKKDENNIVFEVFYKHIYEYCKIAE